MYLTYSGIEITVEKVTPARAAEFLKRNAVNRRMRMDAVNAYSRDMENGTWVFKPLAICFDTDGHLGNGQHTLTAIVKSGVEQWLMIARNVPRASIAAMDAGVTRTITDIAHFLGEEAMNSRKAAVAKAIAFGIGDGKRRSFQETFDAYREHRDAIDFACNLPQKVAGLSAPLLTPCARAWYSRDRVKVARFIEVFRTGIPDGPHESAAMKIRDFYMRRGRLHSKEVRVELYKKTEAALVSFLSEIPMTKVYGMESEQFPVPTTP